MRRTTRAAVEGDSITRAHRARRRCAAAGTLAAVALVLAACGGGGGGATVGQSPVGQADGAGGTSADAPVDTSRTSLRMSLAQEPPDWDFVNNAATAIRTVVSLNVVEPLLEQTADGELEPLLASDYEVSEDKRTYEFTLREASFQDGAPMTAADVVYSMKLNSESPLGPTSQPYRQVEDIEAVDDDTVRVRLKRPSNGFLAGMATDSGMIIKKGTAKSLKQKPMGTGPFIFDAWRQGVSVTLKRFDGYWGEAPPLSDITIQYVTDETSALNQLRAGQLDLVGYLIGSGRDQVQTFQSDPRYTVPVVTTPEKVYVALNGKDPAFDDHRVREAIARSVDPQAVIDGAYGGIGTPVCVLASPGEPGYTKECPYGYDPERAKELLAEAGASDLTVPLKYIKTAAFPAMSDVVVSALDGVGITANPVVRDLPTYFEEVLNSTPSQYQMTILAGPQRIEAWRCPGWFLDTCDKQVDRLLDRADAATSPEEYQSLSTQALLRFTEDAYMIPLATVDVPSVGVAGLAGFASTSVPTSSYDLRRVHWTQGSS